MLLPFPSSQLFQIHGSKFKLHPVCHLSQASVLSIAHCVFFLGVRKDALNGFFSPLVKLLVFWRIAGVICQIFIAFPDMPLYGLYARPGMRAKPSGRTACADSGIAFIFPVTVPVGRGVFENLVFWTDYAVVELIIYQKKPSFSCTISTGCIRCQSIGYFLY